MYTPTILSRVFEQSSDGMLLMNEDGVAIDCNPATVALFGCQDKSEIIGRHPVDFSPEYQPDGRRSEDAARDVLKRAQAEGSLCFEWKHRSVDGRPFYVEALLTAVEVDGHNIIHVNWRDVSRRHKMENALAYRRALETLITNTSSYFINLPAEEIDSGVQKALGDLGTFVDADRSYIFAYQDGQMHNLYEWCAAGIEPQIDRMQQVPINAMAWSNTQIMQGEILNTPVVAHLPPEAQAEKDEFTVQGIQSVLVVPMERHGQVIGFMGFDTVREQRRWPEEVVDLLRIAAGIIANVLARRDAELQLREMNVWLESRVRERTRQLEQRRNVAESLRETLAIINSNQALSDTLDHLVRQATTLLKADAGTLYSLNTQTQSGRIEASVNVFEGDIRHLQFDLTSTSGIEMLNIIAQRKPIIAHWDKADIDTVGTDPNVSDAVRIRRVMVFERFNGSVSIPIFVRDEPFGALLLYYVDVQKLTEQDFEPAAILADQAALAIENTRLHQSAREKHAEAEQRRRIAEGLRDGLAVLNSNRSLNDILEFVVRQAVELLDTGGGALYLLDERRSILHVGASYGLTATYTALELPVGSAITGRAVSLGEPVSVPDIEAASDLLERYLREPGLSPDWTKALEQLKHDYNALISVPVRTRGKIYGAITLYYPTSQQFTNEVIGLAVAFAGQAALVIENARLRERMRETAAIEERNRLARDLHDAVTQTLFSASMIADTLPDLWHIDPDDAQRQLERIGQLTRGALAEMRTLLIELRPARLAETDPGTLLQQLVDAAQGHSKAELTLNIPHQCNLPTDVKIVLYRIAQEALNNIMKHAHARHVFISLRCDDRQVTLQILDDGHGFDTNQVKAGHFGLSIMRERALSIGADFVLDTQPGEGTAIKITWRHYE